MIKNPVSRNLSTYGRMMFTTCFLTSVATMTSLAAANTDSSTARLAIENHPAVAGLRAEVCASTSQIDLAWSRIYPKVDMRLTGGSSLSSNIKQDEGANVNDVYRRRFNDKEIDAVFTVNQSIYDWGITKSSVGIAENTHSSAKLGLSIEAERIAADILSFMINKAELDDHDALYTAHRAELQKIADNIETGVIAGAHRLTDLRTIKISLLDAEVAHLQITRQRELAEADLQERLRLSSEDAYPFYLDYIAAMPPFVPEIESANTREVRRLDLNYQSNMLEITRIKAERRPVMSAILDTTLFDVDSYSKEYEVVGRIQFNFPLYDGGSNKARQSELKWRGRSIEQQRVNLIRNHRTQSDTLIKRIDQLTENLSKTIDKISEVERQLEATLARQGQTESQPLGIANLKIQANSLYLQKSTFTKEIDLERLRGVFFADQLGEILKLTYGTSSC